ncbi:MAG TPA: YtxH domain-containing protein [Candidatus Dormibacteraeota bacterium]|nr:YtxH domain-containing protein [Candidatus Dormibacteraeota bacterium]
MNDSRGSSTTGLVLAFLAGAVSGAVVALLTAPRSGRETRDRIKDLTRDAAGKTVRVPPALNGAYSRAAEAARRAFVEAFEPRAQDRGAPPGRSGH